MLSFTSLALLGLAAVGSLAAPTEKRWSHSKCMTGAEAQQVADNYAELIRNYSEELANEALAVDFTDYSESVNALIDTCPQGKAAKAGPIPLLAPAFDSRAKFETGQGQQPSINFNQLNLEYNCNFITLRWETTNTAPIPTPRPVVGIILIEAEPAPSGNKFPWIVKTVYSEFDSASWLQNLEQAGICQTTASGSPQLPLPSGTVAPAPPPGSASASPASTSTWTSTTSGSSWVASPSETHTDSSAATASGSAAPAYSTTASSSSWTTSSSAASSWTPSTTASSWTASTTASASAAATDSA